MTAFDYINMITEKGGKIRLSGEIMSEMETCSGKTKNSFVKVKSWKREKEKSRSSDVMLERITNLAICVDDPYTFYTHAMLIIPEKNRNGDYDGEKWAELLSHIVLEISSELFSKAIKERFNKSSVTILTILQNRIKEWQKKATIQAEKNEEAGISVQVNIN